MTEDGYQPDYEARCSVCGAFPTVNISEDGALVRESNLCGPCYFGSAEALNVEEWDDL